MKQLRFLFFIVTALIVLSGIGCTSVKEKEAGWVSQYNVIWNNQSKNSSGSMPMVGGNIGCNVWVQNNELLYYFSSPGARDENGSLMKYGRIRISFEPDIFNNSEFQQSLHLEDGSIHIQTYSVELGESKIKLWAEIHNPVVHTEIESDSKIIARVNYENWRTEALLLPYSFGGNAQRGISYSNYPAYDGDVYIYPDEFEPSDESIVFYHRMRMDKCFFPKQIIQQGLEEIKDQLYDPLTNLTFGGKLIGDNLEFVNKLEGQYAQTKFIGWRYKTKKPSKNIKLKVYTHINQTETANEWKTEIDETIAKAETDEKIWDNNALWWNEFWNRSHIIINQDKGADDQGWQVSRNYNIFRYMLVSGFFGKEPTMFNGGVLTFDPEYERASQIGGYTPDYRRFGAALTAQNQRLLYWPMLKNGDYDGLLPQFDWYKDILPTTQGRVKHLWNHDGCMCVEQPTINGILGLAEYGWVDDKLKGTTRYRPADYEVGVSNNLFIGRLHASQIEYSWMMLCYYKFSGIDISEYLPFIEQSVIFYEEHFRMREKDRTGKELDENGRLVFYPTNSLENYQYAKNPTSVIAGLTVVLKGLIDLPDEMQGKEKKERWESMLTILPDYPVGEEDGNKYFKPAESAERNHRTHAPEMYPLYPYELYGLGMDDLDIMKNTISKYSQRFFESSGGWSQNLIHCARLGMTEVAKKLVIDKIEDGPFRFPAFFPGGDYGPDHNVGGSGMIGLQEMLMQTHDNKIHILPSTPKEWDVNFKLHAPQNTLVELVYINGNIEEVHVTPKSREEDIIMY